jgi:ATP-dependent Clp protease ATP-binding subunit ClpC
VAAVFERYTYRARRALVLGVEVARVNGYPGVSPEHVLLGPLHDDDNIAIRILARLGVDRAVTVEWLEASIG